MENSDNVVIEKNKDGKTYKVTITDSNGVVYTVPFALEQKGAIVYITQLEEVTKFR